MSVKIKNFKFVDEEGKKIKHVWLEEGEKTKLAGEIFSKGKKHHIYMEISYHKGKFFTTMGDLEVILSA